MAPQLHHDPARPNYTASCNCNTSRGEPCVRDRLAVVTHHATLKAARQEAPLEHRRAHTTTKYRAPSRTCPEPDRRSTITPSITVTLHGPNLSFRPARRKG
jgi:hypothetical protein